ncbi:hypothetical protein HELRODRAFT_192878 [Helobdella robusta]|uniref:Uncharacterized protein n=1 Tax=Helobdella robusta TaxID=6412 RepID=T1FUD8_HELRO|nr:hypothetical protein HELRODRAFT_192878 [Helobdella robusta]ESN99620.1 hypothetical protein HELRODRAFT_192878 [Helobdella robusta]
MWKKCSHFVFEYVAPPKPKDRTTDIKPAEDIVRLKPQEPTPEPQITTTTSHDPLRAIDLISKGQYPLLVSVTAVGDSDGVMRSRWMLLVHCAGYSWLSNAIQCSGPQLEKYLCRADSVLKLIEEDRKKCKEAKSTDDDRNDFVDNIISNNAVFLARNDSNVATTSENINNNNNNNIKNKNKNGINNNILVASLVNVDKNDVARLGLLVLVPLRSSCTFQLISRERITNMFSTSINNINNNNYNNKINNNYINNNYINNNNNNNYNISNNNINSKNISNNINNNKYLNSQPNVSSTVSENYKMTSSKDSVSHDQFISPKPNRKKQYKTIFDLVNEPAAATTTNNINIIHNNNNNLNSKSCNNINKGELDDDLSKQQLVHLMVHSSLSLSKNSNTLDFLENIRPKNYKRPERTAPSKTTPYNNSKSTAKCSTKPLLSASTPTLSVDPTASLMRPPQTQPTTKCGAVNNSSNITKTKSTKKFTLLKWRKSKSKTLEATMAASTNDINADLNRHSLNSELHKAKLYAYLIDQTNKTNTTTNEPQQISPPQQKEQQQTPQRPTSVSNLPPSSTSRLSDVMGSLMNLSSAVFDEQHKNGNFTKFVPNQINRRLTENFDESGRTDDSADLLSRSLPFSLNQYVINARERKASADTRDESVRPTSCYLNEQVSHVENMKMLKKKVRLAGKSRHILQTACVEEDEQMEVHDEESQPASPLNLTSPTGHGAKPFALGVKALKGCNVSSSAYDVRGQQLHQPSHQSSHQPSHQSPHQPPNQPPHQPSRQTFQQQLKQLPQKRNKFFKLFGSFVNISSGNKENDAKNCSKNISKCKNVEIALADYPTATLYANVSKVRTNPYCNINSYYSVNSNNNNNNNNVNNNNNKTKKNVDNSNSSKMLDFCNTDLNRVVQPLSKSCYDLSYVHRYENIEFDADDRPIVDMYSVVKTQNNNKNRSGNNNNKPRKNNNINSSQNVDNNLKNTGNKCRYSSELSDYSSFNKNEFTPTSTINNNNGNYIINNNNNNKHSNKTTTNLNTNINKSVFSVNKLPESQNCHKYQEDDAGYRSKDGSRDFLNCSLEWIDKLENVPAGSSVDRRVIAYL